jgi:hypothetical protein
MSPLDSDTGRHIAISAEALYLSNLLLLPLLAFALLLALYFRYRNSGKELAIGHLHQAIIASLWAAVLLIPIPPLLLLSIGFDSPAGWTVVILYIVVCHTSLVMIGIIGLTRAMAGRPFRFPLIGRRQS